MAMKILAGQSTGLRVLIGVHEGTLSGIDTYAEQVARAAAAAGHDTTLLAAEPAQAAMLRLRLGSGVRVIDLSLPPPSAGGALLARLCPGLALARLEKGIVQVLNELGETFAVVHLNHPGLAPIMRPYAQQVCAGAWFYPHQLRGRVIEAWRHTQGAPLRRVIMAGKAISHFRNDSRGYRACDRVLAPTPLLADQLADLGIPAVVCLPPVYLAHSNEVPDQPISSPGQRRLLICCGDLSHPRKNVKTAIKAVGLLPCQDGPILLEVIGRNAAAVQAEVESLPSGITVVFTGPLPAHEVQHRMRQADALLFPSLFEEWGYVAVESLLCGTPVVTFPVYPFAAMLAPGFGAQARDLTAEAFADAVQQILQDGRPANLAAGAAERFGGATIGEHLTTLWSSP